MKKQKERIPTWNQGTCLQHLMDGWELIIGKWPDMSNHPTPGVAKYSNTERIYWRIPRPEFKLNPWETIDCGYPKLKRYHMSHMERYGWVVRTDIGWFITKEGEKAKERFEAYSEKLRVKFAHLYKKDTNEPEEASGTTGQNL